MYTFLRLVQAENKCKQAVFWRSFLRIFDCLISGGIPVILRSSGDGKTFEISSKGETDEKTKDDEQKPEESPSANLDPGLISPVAEVTSEAIKVAANAIKGAADVIKGAAEAQEALGEERGSVSSTTGSTRQMGQTTGQVSSADNQT